MKKMLIKQKFLLLLLGCMLPLGMYAQQLTVSGTVTDASDGMGLPGVSVVVKGTQTGTITSPMGDYSLQVNVGDVLQYSFIGFNGEERNVEAGVTRLDVALSTSVIGMDEVVVIGYGSVKKSDATGSVDVVSAKDFNRGAITSPQDLLVGKSSGVVITSSGGAPGSGSTIRVRGGSSLNASNDPLVIVDGVPIDNNNVSGSSNFLSFVNPNDIESFNILKDASATAIYGSRASNGVIIINTKRGKAGSPMRISYDVNTSIASAIKFIDVYSGDEIRQIAMNKKDLFGTDNLSLLWNENTNWQKEIFRTAVSQDNNLSISGALKDIPFRASVGHTNQNGIMKNTNMQRLTGSVSIDPILLDGDLKLNMNVKG